ncbi:MAG: hypothetical protein GKR90_12345 [Pseudomonadales bacterium]|nr:hypothetical protein [Pseudomonadales bacterium]
MQAKSFAFNQSVAQSLGCAIWGAVMCATGGYFALSNEVGLIIKGIELDVVEATVFYSVLSLIGMGVVVVGLNLVRCARLSADSLELTEDGVELPVGFWRQIWLTVSYQEILAIEVTSVPGGKYVASIDTSYGICRLASASFVDNGQFADFVDDLSVRL